MRSKTTRLSGSRLPLQVPEGSTLLFQSGKNEMIDMLLHHLGSAGSGALGEQGVRDQWPLRRLPDQPSFEGGDVC